MAELRDEKDDRPLPHQLQRPRLMAREKQTQKNQATEMIGKRSKIPCRYRNCNNMSCSDWHPTYVKNHKSETGRKYGNKCYFRHGEADEKPSKKSKKGDAKGSVALLKGLRYNCISRFLSEKICSPRTWNVVTPSNSPRAPVTK